MAEFNPDADFELVVDEDSEGFVLEEDYIPSTSSEVGKSEETDISKLSMAEKEELAVKDLTDGNMSVEEYNKKWEGVAFQEEQEVEKLDFFDADRIAGEWDRFQTHGKRAIGDIIAFGSNILGVQTDEFKSKIKDVRKEDDASLKEHKEKFGENAWDIGGTISGVGLEVLAAPTKAVSTAITEAAFSASRNQLFEDNGVDTWEKLLRVGGDVGVAVVGQQLFKALIPSTTKERATDFGKSLEKMKETNKAEYELIGDALTAMDREGISHLDDEAREKLMNSLFEGKVDPVKMSSMVNSALRDAKATDYGHLTNIYKDADSIARMTDDVDISDITAKVERAIRNVKKIDGEDIISSSRKTYEDILHVMDEDDINAETIELIRRELQGLQAGKHKDDKQLFTPIIEMLEKKQDEAFQGIGSDVNPYINARQADIEFKAKWEGSRKGLEDTRTGTTMKQVLDKPSKTRSDMDLLGGGLNRDIAERLSRELPNEPRKQMVYNILQEGVDNPHTMDGLSRVVSNYKKMDSTSLRMLLGKKGADKMRGEIRALDMIKEVEAMRGIPSDIKTDVVDMAAAIATLKISITGGMYRIVNKTRAILGTDIKAINQKKLRLIKRAEEVKSAGGREAVKHLMKKMNVTKEELTKKYGGRAGLGSAVLSDDQNREED